MSGITPMTRIICAVLNTVQALLFGFLFYVILHGIVPLQEPNLEVWVTGAVVALLEYQGREK